jgi:alginate O-acetyltransferase complex protein AlgI
MVFSSHIFLCYFLPLALLLYYAMPQRGRNLLLTLLSYVFYGWVNPLFVVLMLASTTFDYVCGLFISHQFRRRAWKEPVPLLTTGGGRTRAQRIALLVRVIAS